MARKTRVTSEINAYTVVFKSYGEVVFNDFFDEYFLSLLKKGKEDSFELVAYALTDRAYYVLIRNLSVELDCFLRRLTVAFAKKYNKVHNRSGRVFADRAACIPANTDDDVYRMAVSLYKISKATQAKFDSFKNLSTNEYIDNAFLMDKFQNKHNFVKYCDSSIKKAIVQMKLNDKELADFILSEFSIYPDQLVSLTESELTNIINTVYEITTASARQIFRITGIPLKFLWKTYKSLSDGKKGEKSEERKW